MSVNVEPHKDFHDIYWVIEERVKKLATKNLIPSRSVYGERLVHYEDKDVTVRGNFDNSFFVHVASGKIPEDRKLTSTFKLYSHGKVYTITKSFTVSTRLL